MKNRLYSLLEDNNNRITRFCLSKVISKSMVVEVFLSVGIKLDAENFWFFDTQYSSFNEAFVVHEYTKLLDVLPALGMLGVRNPIQYVPYVNELDKGEETDRTISFIANWGRTNEQSAFLNTLQVQINRWLDKNEGADKTLSRLVRMRDKMDNALRQPELSPQKVSKGQNFTLASKAKGGMVSHDYMFGMFSVEGCKVLEELRMVVPFHYSGVKKVGDTLLGNCSLMSHGSFSTLYYDLWFRSNPLDPSTGITAIEAPYHLQNSTLDGEVVQVIRILAMIAESRFKRHGFNELKGRDDDPEYTGRYLLWNAVHSACAGLDRKIVPPRVSPDIDYGEAKSQVELLRNLTEVYGD